MLLRKALGRIKPKLLVEPQRDRKTPPDRPSKQATAKPSRDLTKDRLADAEPSPVEPGPMVLAEAAPTSAIDPPPATPALANSIQPPASDSTGPAPTVEPRPEREVPPKTTVPASPPRPSTQQTPAPSERAEQAVLDPLVFDRIRAEIKSRLTYFQACADAARRRGAPDVRRVQATWFIAADGAIKELKLEDVPDPQLALCIVRMGSRAFPMAPGADLTIPTPIVFVR